MNYISIGRFTLQTDLLAAFLAIFIASFLFRITEKKSLGDWYWNSFFLYIIVSKVTYILFNFKLFIDTPLSIVYFNGGTKGEIIACVSLALYLIYVAVKDKTKIRQEYIPSFFMFLMVYEGLQMLFEQNYVAVFLQFTLLLLFLWLHLKNRGLHSKSLSQAFFLFFLLEAILLSLFDGLFKIENALMLIIGTTIILLYHFNREEN